MIKVNLWGPKERERERARERERERGREGGREGGRERWREGGRERRERGEGGREGERETTQNSVREVLASSLLPAYLVFVELSHDSERISLSKESGPASCIRSCMAFSSLKSQHIMVFRISLSSSVTPAARIRSTASAKSSLLIQAGALSAMVTIAGRTEVRIK